MKRHNIPISRVVQHNHWSGKNCPSGMRSGRDGMTWSKFISLVKEAYSGTTTVNAPVTETKPATSTAKPLTDGKVGDTVKVVGSLYADSTGAGRSTASRGKQGKIKRIVGNSNKYLIEN